MKLPPYSRAAANAAKAGFAPDNSIVIAGDWTLRDTAVWWHASWRAVCPGETQPEEYDWRWVAGFDVVLLARSESRAAAINEAVARSNPRRIVALVLAKPEPHSVIFKAA